MRYRTVFRTYGKVVSSSTYSTEDEAIRAAKSIMASAMGYRGSEIVINKESDMIRFSDICGNKVRGISVKVMR